MVPIGERERQVRADKRLPIAAPRARHTHHDWAGGAVRVQDVEPDTAERLDRRFRTLGAFLIA